MNNTTNNEEGEDENMKMDDDDDDSHHRIEEDEDYEEEEPAFIDMNNIDKDDTIVEVVDVDLENEPMDDDDDDDDEDTKGLNSSSKKKDGNNDDDGVVVVDMAKAVIKCHNGPIYAVAAASTVDSSSSSSSFPILYIASGGGDDKAFLTQITTTFSDETAATAAAAAATSSSQVSSSYNVESKELIAPNHKFTDTVSCVAFNNPLLSSSSDGGSGGSSNKVPNMLATGCYDGTIQLWDVGGSGSSSDGSSSTTTTTTTNEIKYLRQLDGPSDIEWLSWHPNGGTVLLAGSTDGTIWMWYAINGKCLQVFVGHDNDVSCGSFTIDGKSALSCGVDGTLRLWNPKKGICKHVFRNCDKEEFADGPITCMDIGGGMDLQLVIVGCENGKVFIVHLGNKKVLSCLIHHESSTTNTPSDAMQDDDDDDEDEGEGEPLSVEAVGFAKQSKNNSNNWCATGGVDGVLKIWDLNTNQCRQTCISSSSGEVGGGAGITRLVWHETQQPYIYTCYVNGNIQLWDSRSGLSLFKLSGHKKVINSMHVICSPSLVDKGKDVIITGSDDQTIRLFHVDINDVK